MSDFGELRAYAVVVGLSVGTIYAGSFASLRMPKEARRRLRKALTKGKGAGTEKEEAEDDEKDDDEEEDDEEPIDRLTAEDAYLFPILGSVVLFGLYLAFKFLDKALINRILGAYLALMGVGALSKVIASSLKSLMPKKRWNSLDKWKFALHRNKEEYASVSYNLVHVFALVLGITLQVVQLCRPFWALSNLIALSFAFGAISLMRLDSFWTGSALLALLYLYDVWWVFGSKHFFGADVMVSVAKSFDAPIKILFPRTFIKPLLLKGKDFVLLGLGDIVLPGIFVALALRWDYHRAIKAKVPPTPKGKWGKPYFRATALAYAMGLMTTILMMHMFKAAQPALLYLSPACIGAICLTAWRRGEWKQVWEFEDASDDEPSAEDAKKGAKGQEKVNGEASGVETKKVLRSRTVEVGAPSGNKKIE